MTVRGLQGRLDRLNEQSRKVAEDFDRRKRLVLQQLEPICDHRVTEEYKWEHDNGYGKQSKCIGLLCVHCRARRPYQTMGTWMSAKEWSQCD
jgi:hypothetical protein